MAFLSTKGIYGLIAILEIAKGDKQNPVSLKDISDKINVSKNYLEQVLNSLRNAKIVGSIKGIKGGYFLLKALDEITFYEVFRTMEIDFSLANLTNVKSREYSLFFKEYDDKIKDLFSRPLSSFGEYEKQAKKYLNYII